MDNVTDTGVADESVMYYVFVGAKVCSAVFCYLFYSAARGNFFGSHSPVFFLRTSLSLCDGRAIGPRLWSKVFKNPNIHHNFHALSHWSEFAKLFQTASNIKLALTICREIDTVFVIHSLRFYLFFCVNACYFVILELLDHISLNATKKIIKLSKWLKKINE